MYCENNWLSYLKLCAILTLYRAENLIETQIQELPNSSPRLYASEGHCSTRQKYQLQLPLGVKYKADN